MITFSSASVLERLEAILSPFADGFLVPMMATLGWGSGSAILPATKSVLGANFCSISLKGPRSSSDDTRVTLDPVSDEPVAWEVALISGTPPLSLAGTSKCWDRTVLSLRTQIL